MSKATQRIRILNNKIATAKRHNQNYALDLISLEDATRETKNLIDRNVVFIKASNKELQDIKDQEFQRYLHTACYKYRVNG